MDDNVLHLPLLKIRRLEVRQEPADGLVAKNDFSEREQPHVVYLAGGALAYGIELPYGLDLVAEKLDAHGVFPALAVYIEDAPAHAEGPDIFHDLGPRVAGAHEVRYEGIGLYGLTRFHPGYGSPEIRGRQDLPNEAPHRNDDYAARPLQQGCKGPQPRAHDFLMWRELVVREDLPVGHVKHLGPAENAFQVIPDLLRLGGTHDDYGPVYLTV